jgi:hypothetical protein
VPVLRPAEQLRLALWFGAGVALVLFWGCLLVYEVGYGTGICEDYTYGNGGPNDALDRWCNGESWQGWLTTCLCFAAVSLAAGRVLAARWGRPPIVAGTLLACVAVWAGFGLPQVLAQA